MKRLIVLGIIMSILLILSQTKLPERESIPEKYKWDLTKIYMTEKEWEKDYQKLKKKKEEYKKYKDIFLQNENIFYEYLKFDGEIKISLEKLNLYASLNRDLDLADPNKAELFDRIQTLGTEISTENSFFEPSLLKVDRKIIDKFFSKKVELKVYKYFIDEIYRLKEHTLSEQEEKLLASAALLVEIPYEIFSIFTDSEIEFPTILDEN
jgi:oligoendopeptidase F